MMDFFLKLLDLAVYNFSISLAGIFAIGIIVVVIIALVSSLETAGTILISFLFLETAWSLYSAVTETAFNAWPRATYTCTDFQPGGGVSCDQGVWSHQALILDISYKIFALLGFGLIWLFLHRDKVSAFWIAVLAQIGFAITFVYLVHVNLNSGPNN